MNMCTGPRLAACMCRAGKQRPRFGRLRRRGQKFSRVLLHECAVCPCSGCCAELEDHTHALDDEAEQLQGQVLALKRQVAQQAAAPAGGKEGAAGGRAGGMGGPRGCCSPVVGSVQEAGASCSPCKAHSPESRPLCTAVQTIPRSGAAKGRNARCPCASPRLAAACSNRMRAARAPTTAPLTPSLCSVPRCPAGSAEPLPPPPVERGYGGRGGRGGFVPRGRGGFPPRGGGGFFMGGRGSGFDSRKRMRDY